LFEEGVFRVDDNGQRIESNRHFDVFNTRRLAVRHFRGFDRAGSIGEISFTATEFLEAATRAGNADGNFDRILFGLLELFSDCLGDRINRRGTVNLDDIGMCRLGAKKGNTGRRHEWNEDGFLDHWVLLHRVGIDNAVQLTHALLQPDDSP
jgi:hypothetical protein